MEKDKISSQELARFTHVNPTQIRRDLSGFGKFGKRGVGYNVDFLIEQIRAILHTAAKYNIALFGAGHLGKAIAGSEVFADHGFEIKAVFDNDAKKVGTLCGNVEVQPGRRSAPDGDRRGHRRRRDRRARRSRAARRRRAGRAGVTIIFNYTDRLLDVPQEVTVHTSSPAVDLLYALYFYLA